MMAPSSMALLGSGSVLRVERERSVKSSCPPMARVSQLSPLATRRPFGTPPNVCPTKRHQLSFETWSASVGRIFEGGRPEDRQYFHAARVHQFQQIDEQVGRSLAKTI